MRISSERRRTRGPVVLGSFVFIVALMAAGSVSAWAQVSLPTSPVGGVDTADATDLLPTVSPIPTPSLPVEDLPVDEVLPDVLNDTIKELPPLPGIGDPTTDGGGGTTVPPGGSSGSGSSGSGATSGGGSSGGSGATPNGSTDAGSPGAGSGGGAPTSKAGVDARTPYVSAAGKATVAALSRALRLSGPFAAPMALAMAALAVLIAIGRGSDRLVKLERLNVFRETYKL